MFATTGRMGAGVVIRDHDGMFLPACGERYDNMVASENAEALAARRAICFTQEEGYSKIIIALD
jgi:hypothetical protein